MIEQGKPNKNRQVEIINLLCSYLDNGYVYSDIYNVNLDCQQGCLHRLILYKCNRFTFVSLLELITQM